MVYPTDASRLAARDYPKDRTPIMEQHWHKLLFLHWEYEVEEIQRTLPKGLHVDTFEGKAYIGVVPFWVPKVNLKFLPAFPGASSFFELNVRTYVYDDSGMPGVWFYSLDANHFLAVQAAKTFFFLPYRHAQIDSFVNQEGQVEFNCRSENVELDLSYRYKGEEPYVKAKPGSLDFFLIERYLLFADKGEKLAYGQVHHEPYSIGKADVLQWDDRILELDGLKRGQRPPDHVHYSPGVDVDIFALEDVLKR